MKNILFIIFVFISFGLNAEEKTPEILNGLKIKEAFYLKEKTDTSTLPIIKYDHEFEERIKNQLRRKLEYLKSEFESSANKGADETYELIRKKLFNLKSKVITDDIDNFGRRVRYCRNYIIRREGSDESQRCKDVSNYLERARLEIGSHEGTTVFEIFIGSTGECERVVPLESTENIFLVEKLLSNIKNNCRFPEFSVSMKREFDYLQLIKEI
ncbi:hypothetical protein QFX18_19085 [Saccharophagus degradans]|uniref:hypothetical protein n=1 Tax=Saccharophagus degradans TaxID=86304 RepID=UPI002477D9D8|nr:hypothetical protein [Saccharophagus degradans]WGO98114.1 hypothetical protein QFX18_19085 [Saccharophagus degradans]